MDRLAAISAFVAVVEQKGFAAAARHLAVTPSAVTRLVSALEDHLDVRLLQRTTRVVSLTDAGARFLERSQAILGQLREAEDSARSERTRPVGRLVVAAPTVFGRLHATPLLGSYLDRYPEVSAELLLSDRQVHLVEEGVDLAIRIGTLADSSLMSRKLGQTRRVVVASPAYIDAFGIPETPADLHRFSLVAFTGFGGNADWSFVRDGREERMALSPRVTTNSADAAIAHAQAGLGLTRVLVYQVAEAVGAGRLRILLSAFEPPPMPIQIVYPSSRLLSAKVRCFIDMAEETVRWDFRSL